MRDGATFITPSAPDGTAVLRGLAFGAKLCLVDDGWEFADTTDSPAFWNRLREYPLWPTGVFDASVVEWLSETGLARQDQGGTRFVITPRGGDFLREMDAAAQACAMSLHPLPISELARRITYVRRDHPDEDTQALAFFSAQMILHATFGTDWMIKHIQSVMPPTNFFRNTALSDYDHAVAILRIIRLAEMVFNLQFVEGVSNSIELITSGKVEDGFAELEVAKLLHLNGHSFRILKPDPTIGATYDLEIAVGTHTACAETKCKLETTTRSERTVLVALQKAQTKQLPADRPGIIFVSVPQSWASPKDEAELGGFMKSVTDRFFRGTKRIVSVKFHSSMTLDDASATTASPVIYLREFANPSHRFDTSVDWTLFSEMERLPTSWVSLMEACALPEKSADNDQED